MHHLALQLEIVERHSSSTELSRDDIVVSAKYCSTSSCPVRLMSSSCLTCDFLLVRFYSHPSQIMHSGTSFSFLYSLQVYRCPILGLYSRSCSSSLLISYIYSFFCFKNFLSSFFFTPSIFFSTVSDLLLTSLYSSICLFNFYTLFLKQDFGFISYKEICFSVPWRCLRSVSSSVIIFAYFYDLILNFAYRVFGLGISLFYQLHFNTILSLSDWAPGLSRLSILSLF